MPRSRKSKGGRNRQNKQSMGQSMISRPPDISSYEIRHSTRLRFVTNAAVALNVTFQNLLDTLLVATTALLGSDVFYAVKIRKVEAWTSPALGTASSLELVFDGGTAGGIGDQHVHQSTSMGIEPAHIHAVPSVRSLASNFQISGTQSAFFFASPTGTVVDVELSFIGQFAGAVAAQNALVGATPGAFYTRGLDGLAIATTKFTPVLSVAQI